MANSDFAEFGAPGNRPILDDIFQVSDKFLGGLRLWLEMNPPATPIASILGFAQTTAKPATTISTSETTTSTTYADLATTGPTLSGLPDGKYLFLFSGFVTNSLAGNGSLMALSVNGATPADDDSAAMNGTSGTTVTGFLIATLANAGNSTVTAKYRVGGGTGTFQRRKLVAFRYANP